MVTVYYTEIKDVHVDIVFEQQLNKLPGRIKDKILTYTSRQEQLSRLCGKLLLSGLLKNTSLNDMLYNEYGKPYFKGNFDFSIAHSGNIVICAAAPDSRIGVDIEKRGDIDISLMQEHFTVNEWDQIISGKDRHEAFYKMWVRKEACLKATGKGSHQPLHQIDVCGQVAFIDGTAWYLHDIFIRNGYSSCIATDKDDNIQIIEVNINTLLNGNQHDA